MKTYNLCLLGFGNVGKALLRLLVEKRATLRDRYGFDWQITGVASRRLGWIAAPDGLDPETLLRGELPAPMADTGADPVRAWLDRARADVLFENSSLNAQTGQPAIHHLRTALELGAHAITANKGPIVHAYHDLRDLALQHGKRFMFESTVMDGAPIFSLFRDALPAASIVRFRGILNSTTNYILTRMEAGLDFDAAVREAQAIGIAETDPSADVDGWDATVKVTALATVLMDSPLDPAQVERSGIRGLTGEAVQEALAQGFRYKLVCTAERDEAGSIRARVGMEKVSLTDPLASVMGTSSLVHFETDVLPGLTLTEHNPGPKTTAYGLLADLINALR
ncbi:MAG: homoserine dehydrogenase [Anaerolineae bacterium]|nr:homoserine dehydrogenase [Anaerolineae bacterium]